MKKFFRSIVGKITLFFLFVFSTTALLLTVVSVFHILNNDFYKRSQNDIIMENRYHKVFNEIIKVGKDTDFDFSLIDQTFGDSLSIKIVDDRNKKIYCSGQFEDKKQNEENMTFSYQVEPKYEDKKIEDYGIVTEASSTKGLYNLEVVLDKDYYIDDIDKLSVNINKTLYSLRYFIYLIGLFFLTLSVITFVIGMCEAGVDEDSEKLKPGLFFAVPFDFIVAFSLGIWAIGGIYLYSNRYIEDNISYFLYFIYFELSLVLFFGLTMSFASRVKQKALVKNTVIYWIFSLFKTVFLWLGELIVNIPLVIREVLIMAGVIIIEFVLMISFNLPDRAFIIFGIEKVIITPFVIYALINMKRLQNAGEKIASGDLNYKVDTSKMTADLKRHGENLNNLSNVLSAAVESKLKSERMKTELITNVSHDIKTPLTSIINYATLISNDNIKDLERKEYSNVLIRQSEKLKRLIEDLVEASKASTGNIEIELNECDAAIFVSQAAGEYADKMLTSNLTLVTSISEEDLKIMADWRRLWRVFDNLMNNIVKYAQPNTRVYLSLDKINDKAVFTFKNTSSAPLNISADELMERFVRGDSSRHTDGNGLGLSIARSLTELMGGKFELNVDGDLFKATISFDLIN